jgi:uncharacterized protein
MFIFCAYSHIFVYISKHMLPVWNILFYRVPFHSISKGVSTMKKLIVFIFIGFLAQLIDGSLGMAYGVTSTSLLLAFGVAPAVASASIHLAEVVTTAASGAAHIRFGNVDRFLVKTMIVPGAIGAFVGACFLSGLPGEAVKPFIAGFLFFLGVYILYRFTFATRLNKRESKPYTKKTLIPLALLAGFADATGGGGWGPISTPVLLARRGIEARKVIGSVDTSEFAIAASASLGFFLSLGWQEVNWYWVLTLMAGGLAAAPIAAWLVKIIPPRYLGVLVGGCILLTNARTAAASISLPESSTWILYAVILLGWCGCLAYLIYTRKK